MCLAARDQRGEGAELSAGEAAAERVEQAGESAVAIAATADALDAAASARPARPGCAAALVGAAAGSSAAHCDR